MFLSSGKNLMSHAIWETKHDVVYLPSNFIVGFPLGPFNWFIVIY